EGRNPSHVRPGAARRPEPGRDRPGAVRRAGLAVRRGPAGPPVLRPQTGRARPRTPDLPGRPRPPAVHHQGRIARQPGGAAARLRFLLDNRATVVFATPTYALHLAEVARASAIDLPGSAVRAVVVAGEPGGSVPATRARLEAGWGARCFDHNGMTETGPLGI